MAQGFIKGALWGVGVSVIAVTMLSVIDDMPERPTAVGLASGGVGGSGNPGENRGRNGDGPSAASVVTSEVSAPEPDRLSELLAEAMSPAAVPDAGAASDLNGASVSSESALSGITSAAQQPPTVQISINGVLEAPATEPGFSIGTDITQPPTPEALPEQTAFAEPAGAEQVVAEDDQDTVALSDVAAAPGAPTEPETVAETVAEAEISRNPAQPETPSVPTSASAYAVPQGALAKPETREAEANLSDSSDDIAETADGSPVPPEVVAAEQSLARAPEFVQTAMQPRQETFEMAQVSPDVGSLTEPAAHAPGPATELPAPERAESANMKKDVGSAPVDAEVAVVLPETGPDTDRVAAVPVKIATAPDAPNSASLPEVSNTETIVPVSVSNTEEKTDVPQAEPTETPTEVRVNRLPTLGTPAAPEAEQEVEVVAVAPAEEPQPGTPVERYAANFENPDNKPLMAVVLIDQGGDLDDPGTGIPALRALPYPVSFAVDALAPDAADRMAAYRGAGFEVLAMIDLPAGATATDAEVNVSAALDKLPQVIGVLEGVGTGVQTTPMAGRQVAQILAQTGHGLVTQNRGLNTVQKLAARQGVPSNSVFRDFDGKSQSERVIRRFMDQAAFRAGQEGGVVMLGRLQENTLSALLSWSLQDRASTVAMAPVSAVLIQEQGS